jgi:hypothetical protein
MVWIAPAGGLTAISPHAMMASQRFARPRCAPSKRDGQLLIPIVALCGDENGESRLGLPPEDEDRIMQEAAEFVPACVSEIAAYWRRKGPKQISMPLTPVGSAPIRKQGWSQ